jgi:hypothetical protein
MFRKRLAVLTLSCMVAAMAIVGIMYSCSNAESSAKKTGSATKSTAPVKESLKPGVKVSSADSLKKEMVTPPKEDRQLIVYYFRTTYRCPSCHYIEETTQATLKESFAEQLKSGRIVFKMLNVEESGNEHFTDDYKLYTKSVVLSDRKGAKETRWKNLDQVWQLIHNDDGFREYIKKEVNAYLGV